MLSRLGHVGTHMPWECRWEVMLWALPMYSVLVLWYVAEGLLLQADVHVA